MGANGNSANEGDSSVNNNSTVTVHIRCSNGYKFSIQTGLNATVGVFKVIITPAEQQRLIYNGGVLNDEQTLESYDRGRRREKCTSGRGSMLLRSKWHWEVQPDQCIEEQSTSFGEWLQQFLKVEGRLLQKKKKGQKEDHSV